MGQKKPKQKKHLWLPGKKMSKINEAKNLGIPRGFCSEEDWLSPVKKQREKSTLFFSYSRSKFFFVFFAKLSENYIFSNISAVYRDRQMIVSAYLADRRGGIYYVKNFC